MVQGHRVNYLVRVNILLQEKVQRITPTSLMQVSTVVLYHLRGIVVLSLDVNFIHVGNFWSFLPFELNLKKNLGG